MSAAPIYHRATFQLLGGEPSLDAESLAVIETVETAAGVKLPAAVREWYGRIGAVEHLRQDRIEGDAISLGEVLETFQQLAALDESARRHLRVLIGAPTQHRYLEWAIALDGSEDPPVMRGVEDTFGGELTWRLVPFAGRFSDFVFYWVWTHRTAGVARGRDAAWLRAEKDRSLLPPDLDFLVDSFHEGPRIDWGDGAIEYCFFDRNGRVGVVSDSIDSEGGLADWRLFADSPEQLEALARKVWHCGGLQENLEAETETGQVVLERLRSEK